MPVKVTNSRLPGRTQAKDGALWARGLVAMGSRAPGRGRAPVGPQGTKPSKARAFEAFQMPFRAFYESVRNLYTPEQIFKASADETRSEPICMHRPSSNPHVAPVELASIFAARKRQVAP